MLFAADRKSWEPTDVGCHSHVSGFHQSGERSRMKWTTNIAAMTQALDTSASTWQRFQYAMPEDDITNAQDLIGYSKSRF